MLVWMSCSRFQTLIGTVKSRGDGEDEGDKVSRFQTLIGTVKSRS